MSKYTTRQILEMIEANGGPEGLDLSGKDLSEIDLSRGTVEAELDRARKGNPKVEPVWWPQASKGVNLEGANLQGADLVIAHLEGANLRGANLVGVDLRGVHLEEADLWHAHLEGSDLAQANLKGAFLNGAHLEGSDLPEVDLEGADVTGEQLAHAALLLGAILPDGTKLSEEHWEAEFEEWRKKQGEGER